VQSSSSRTYQLDSLASRTITIAINAAATVPRAGSPWHVQLAEADAPPNSNNQYVAYNNCLARRSLACASRDRIHDSGRLKAAAGSLLESSRRPKLEPIVRRRTVDQVRRQKHTSNRLAHSCCRFHLRRSPAAVVTGQIAAGTPKPSAMASLGHDVLGRPMPVGCTDL